VISAIDGLIIVFISLALFQFPFQGSVLLFCALSLLFFIAVLGYGLLISAIARNALQAILLALLLIFPPIFFSGFDHPFSLLPTPLKVVGCLFPMTFYNISRDHGAPRDRRSVGRRRRAGGAVGDLYRRPHGASKTLG
jgi:ABC-2 type transport system permease protein